jgi:hypothetical protein
MAKLTKAEKLMFLKIFEKCTFQIEYGLEDTIAGSDDVPEEHLTSKKTWKCYHILKYSITGF